MPALRVGMVPATGGGGGGGGVGLEHRGQVSGGPFSAGCGLFELANYAAVVIRQYRW